MLVVRMMCMTIIVVAMFIFALFRMSQQVLLECARVMLHIDSAFVYGKRDPNARVFTFNHPCYMDMFVLSNVLGDYAAVARDMTGYFPGANYIMKSMGCVLVKANGGQNTTKRIQDNLKSHKKPIAIATTRGIVPDHDLPVKLPTIAYRLNERVQHIVIMYDHVDIIPDTLPKCWDFIQKQRRMVKPHVFFLPSINPDKDFTSAEECASHVRKQMMYILRRFGRT